MDNAMDFILILLILPDFVFLGSSRLSACIRALSVQGVLLGFLPILRPNLSPTPRMIFLALAMIFFKGLVLPRLLDRAVRQADVRREVEPFIDFSASILLGIIFLAISFYFASRLPLPDAEMSSLAVTVGFFNIFVGFILLVSRKIALNQVIGYLVLESGIFIFGAALALELPVMLELGILLDVFVAVFVMGIVIFHISRTFEHIDTNRFSSIKD